MRKGIIRGKSLQQDVKRKTAAKHERKAAGAEDGVVVVEMLVVNFVPNVLVRRA